MLTKSHYWSDLQILIELIHDTAIEAAPCKYTNQSNFTNYDLSQRRMNSKILEIVYLDGVKS